MRLRKFSIEKYYVYHLIDPSTNIPFYVGKGCGNRMYKHEKDVLRGNVPNKTNYDLFDKISEIHKNGKSVIHEKMCDETNEITSLALESAFIEHYGMESLCNYTRGWFGDSQRSEETRRRQSVANKGVRSYMFGVKKTEEQKQKNRLAHTGTNNSRYDLTIYKFYNFHLNIVEECTQFEFRKKYKIGSPGLHRLISGKRASVNGWTLGKRLEDIESERRIKISQYSKGRPKSDEHKRNLWKNRTRNIK
jgi:hypothetical protein